jgi:hypothetical protein
MSLKAIINGIIFGAFCWAVIGLVIWGAALFWATTGTAEDLIDSLTINIADIATREPETIEWEDGSVLKCRLVEPRKYECEKADYDDPLAMGCVISFNGYWVCL